jgi:hypothetical protein
VALNGDGEFRCDFCDYIMTPIVYTSFCTAKNALAVAPESPPSRTGVERSGQVFLLVSAMAADYNSRGQRAMSTRLNESA